MNDEALIDRVARGMTEGELPADFRARVLARLPQTRQGSWIRIAIPAGTIAALGLAWIIAGPSGSTGSSGPTGSVAIADASAGLAGPAGPVGPAGPADWEPVEPDEPVEPGFFEPIVIAPIQPILPAIAPITVEPIVSEPLSVPPLESRAGGRH